MENPNEPKESPAGRSFVSILIQWLGIAEKVALALAVAILVIKRMGYSTGGALLVALSALAVVYFLNGYMPVHTSSNTSEKPGFADVLYLTLIPKVGWISCSVAIVGISFRLMHLPGGREMMLIGFAVSLLSIIIIGIGFLQESGKAKELNPLLTRLLPLSAICGYFLFVP